MLKLSKKWWLIGGGIVAVLVLAGLILMRFGGSNFEINNKGGNGDQKAVIGVNSATSPLTGITCQTGNSRPFAIMVSSDAEARPLSGIGEADWVFEMPVVPNGFTRMMAVFQCGRPKEVGSVRSSRLDFVPLALGVNAIYAHFGGEHTVLQELNDGVINNIDGLKYDGTYYYRKANIPKPHNAFTNFGLLTDISSQLGYNMAGANVSYPHETDSKSQGNASPGPVFNPDYSAVWKYAPSTNSYLRTRSGQAEIDKNTGKQVEAKNIAIMKTTWSPISKDYIRVKTVGSGGLLLYKNGIVVTGTWEKKDDNAKLYFYDANHKEIPLVIGSTWVEIVTTN